MPKRDVVVIGASTGGIEALRTLVGGLPKDFAASIFVVMHSSPDSPGLLGLILGRASQLPTLTPGDKEQILPGHIYVAPPDYHLLIDDGRVCLSKGPKENRFRPAIDPLFRSAARAYKNRVIGVVLTGGLDDGTAGLWIIKKLGGVAVVQDPDDAVAPSMPLSALKHVDVDYTSTISDMAPLLARLTETELEMNEGEIDVPEDLEVEVRIAKQDPAIDFDVRKLWEPSSYTCPDCHGVLLELKEGQRERYRCHTGHAYSIDSLLFSLTERVEESLWTTIRLIEESALLLRHLAGHLMDQSESQKANEFSRKADEAQDRSNEIRQLVTTHEQLSFEEIEQKVR
jgi:two-component system chemotaxis response regulator CheB